MGSFRLPVAGVLAAATFIALAGVVPAGAHNGDRLVRLQDDCDPQTFNAVLGEGACVGDGGTTFDELVEELLDEGEAGKWRTNPRKTHIRHGGSLHVVNEGGEPHTFTPVARFGAGCVPELNELSGLTGPPVADCGFAFTRTFVPAGGSFDVDGLRPGRHRFECMIHPWMHTTVKVRRHH